MARPQLILSETQPHVRLGRYDVGPELGRGFSSIVYDAVDTVRGRRVALKVLTFLQNLSPARRQELAERFEREARAISALSHPAIVSIYEVGLTDDGRQYIAMEFLDGETLRERLERTGPMLRSEVIPLMVQIADALQYAHGRGIIHRDVKPDNIFLCPDGTARLMDFGIAHVFADDGLTQTGMLIGSPAYMSPEQINGQILDGRTDVFSMAATMAEALTARKPFDAPNIPAVMNRILNQPPQLTGIGSIPMRKTLERALAKNPHARTPSAGAFAESLRRVMPYAGSLETTTGTQVMVRPQFSQPVIVSRNKKELLAWIAVGLALAALASLPFFSHSHHAALVQSRVIVERAPPQGRHYELQTQWRRAARPGPPPKLAARITEVFPVNTGSGSVPIRRYEPSNPVVPSLPAKPSLPAPSGQSTTTFARVDAPQIAARQFASSPTIAAPRLAVVPQSIVRPTVSPPMAVPQTVAPKVIAPPITPASRVTPPSEPLNPVVTGAAPLFGNVDTAPRLVLRTANITPPSGSPVSGTVGLLVSVNDEGTVSGARVLQSSGNSELDMDAIATVMHWEFEPAFLRGRAVRSNVAETITY